jgi:PAS domain S-box-containing protein
MGDLQPWERMDLEQPEAASPPGRGQDAGASAAAMPEHLAAALFAALYTKSPFSVGLYDAGGHVVACNPAYERHWGISFAEVPADYSLFDDPQLRTSGLLRHIRRAYAGEHVVLPRVRYDAARAAGVGRAVWTQGHCAPVRDASGAVTHVAIIHEDVTDRVEAERALEASEARFRELLEQAPDAILVSDAEGRYTDANVNACRMLGYSREQLLALDATALVAESDLPKLEPFRRRLLASPGTVIFDDWLVRRADGSIFPAEVSTKLLPDGSRQSIVRDTSERRRAEQERERLYAAADEARRAAEAANKAKGDFLAVMSHELRTPLNAIGGYAELLELGIHGPVTDDQRDALSRIQRSQQHLLGLINDVLNFVKLEAGHVRYEIEDVPLRPALEVVQDFVAPQLRAKEIRYELQDDVGDARRVAVRADAEKLRQVLLNLLSNAIKFTDRGGAIRVACHVHGHVVRVAVTDTGIGIPADRIEHVFEPFVQIGRQFNRPTEGVGLGLAISRDLARGMNGDLTASSEVGRGSTFTLTLLTA